MSKVKIICTSMLCVVLTQSAHSKFYIEGYGGGLTGCSSVSHLATKNIYDIAGLNASFQVPQKSLSPALIGGMKFGLWQKYLGCYLDLSLSRLNYHRKTSAAIISYTNTAVSPAVGPCFGNADLDLTSKGPATNLSLMFACRTNLAKFQPYLGVGPAILYTKQKAKLVVGPHVVDGVGLSIVRRTEATIEPKSKSSKVAACLAVDAGVRHLLSQNIFFDYSLKYRFAVHKFLYNSTNTFTETDAFTIKHQYNLFSLHLGIGYNF